MKRTLILAIAAILAAGDGVLYGQATTPTIQFDSNPTPLTMPDNVHLGEVAGVATNSKGRFVTRTGNPTITIGTARRPHGGGRLFVFDRAANSFADRPGHLRIPAAAAGPRRCAGQHLGRRPDVDAGDQVRPEQARSDGAGPQARSDDGPESRLSPL
jgi:hypothetical protein